MKKFKSFLGFLSACFVLASCSQGTIKKSTFKYPQASENDYVGTAYFTDDYFLDDSTVYNSSLATCSIAFAMSSFASNVNKDNPSHRYLNAEAFLNENGFTDIDVNSYYKVKYTTDSLGMIFGQKKIGDTTLIAVGLRGQNYEMEWAGNVTVGDGKDNPQHKGFYDASTIYLDSLKEYVKNSSVTGEVKLWTVGYSRAGASNNLAIGRLDKEISKGNNIFDNKISLKKENIYCYCFEPPMGASYLEEVSPRDEIYSNIHNIVNCNDPVPMVAMKEYHFTRYGVDYYLPDQVRNKDYESLLSPVLTFYNEMDNHSNLGEYYLSKFVNGGSFFSKTNSELTVSDSSYNKTNWTSGLYLSSLVSSLATIGISSREEYVEKLQTGLRNIFQIVYKNGSPKFSFMTLGVSLLSYLLNSTNVDILINNLLHDPAAFVSDFIVLCHSVMSDLGMDISPNDLTSCINGLLSALTKVFLNDLELFFTLLSMDNVHCLASAHYPELCFAHMMSQDVNYGSKKKEYNSDGSYYYVEIRDITSNTSIRIEDSKGETVASLQNGVLDKSGEITYGSNGPTFFAYLPVEQEYRIVISSASSYQITYFDQTQENMVSYKTGDVSSSNETEILTETYPEKKAKA